MKAIKGHYPLKFKFLCDYFINLDKLNLFNLLIQLIHSQ